MSNPRKLRRLLNRPYVMDVPRSESSSDNENENENQNSAAEGQTDSSTSHEHGEDSGSNHSDESDQHDSAEERGNSGEEFQHENADGEMHGADQPSACQEPENDRQEFNPSDGSDFEDRSEESGRDSNAEEFNEDRAAQNCASEYSGDSEDDEDNGDSDDNNSDDNGSDDNGSDDNGSDDNDENGEEGRNQPLYNGAPLSLHESMMAVMTLVIAHSLTGSCVADILALIVLHCPQANYCVRTLYKFKKYFAMVGQKILKFHFYCFSCFNSLQTKDSMCEFCDNNPVVSYFIELPILNQLQSMFLREGFLNKLQFRFTRQKKNPNSLEDIYDARLYQEHFQPGQFLHNPNNISFMAFWDGLAIFKGSTSYSVWPLYLVCNELSYKDRTKKENMVLAGLWFGLSKPDPNLFLRPFLNFFQLFSETGHMFNLPNNQNPIRVKGMLMCATCDYQAKTLFMRMKAHNGYYGCTRCKSPGQNYQLGPTSRVHVHPYQQHLQERNHNEIQECVNRARETGTPHLGVLGLSILYYILPDFIRSMGIDIMHAIFLGVCKLLTNLWFDVAYSQSEFSLHNVVELVDQRLKKMKPPSFVQRMPRSIQKNLKQWKASEFKMWMFYYSVPVLKGIMREEYLEHYIKLISAIFLLSQESVSLENIRTARTLLHSFVEDFQRLYGLRYLGINVHQLLHLPDVVLDLGPLWIYSCFFFESMNGYLARLFHGTRHVGIQICSSVSVFLNLSVMIRDLNVSEARSFCERLTSDAVCVKINEQVLPASNHCYTVGNYSRPNVVPHAIVLAMRRCLNIVGGRYKLFHRLRKRGVMYSAQTYTRSSQKISTFVSFSQDNASRFCAVNYFVRWTHCECNDNCECAASYYVIGTLYNPQHWLAYNINNVNLSYLCKVMTTEEMVAFPVNALTCLCFYLRVNDEEYIARPINTLEIE